MNKCELWITRAETSCDPPQRIFKEVALSIVTAEEMGAESDAESLIEMLVDKDTAF